MRALQLGIAAGSAVSAARAVDTPGLLTGSLTIVGRVHGTVSMETIIVPFICSHVVVSDRSFNWLRYRRPGNTRTEATIMAVFAAQTNGYSFANCNFATPMLSC